MPRVALILLGTALLSAFAFDSIYADASATSSDEEQQQAAPSGNYIYEGDKDAAGVIVEYTEGGDRNFDANKGVPRVVEFYDPLCRACKAFKSSYIKLANEAKKTKPATLPASVQFHAVSCRAHMSTCQNFGIKAYPTLMALPAGGETLEDAKQIRKGALGSYTLRTIAEALSDDEDASYAESVSRKLMDRVKDDDDNTDDEDDNADDDADEDSEEGVPRKDPFGRMTDRDDENTDEEDTKVQKAHPGKAFSKTGIRKERVARTTLVKGGEGVESDDADDNPTDEEDKNVRKRAALDGEKDDDDNVSGDGEKKESTPKESAPHSYPFRKVVPTNVVEPKKPVPFRKLPREEEHEEKDGDDDRKDDDEPEESEESDSEPPLPGPPKYPGQIRPGAVPNFVPNPVKLAQTGMQPQDIEKYQALFAKRRAEAAKRGARPMPFRQTRNKFPVNGSNGALSPTEEAKLTEERKRKAKAVLDKRTEMLKKLREEQAKTVRREISPRKSKMAPIGQKKGVGTKVLSAIPIVKRAVKPKAEEELYGDAALSFVTGLKTGVYNDERPLDAKRQKALVDWLELLSVSLPPELGLHFLIDDLLNNMNYISQSQENLFAQLDKHPLANKFWSASCSKNRSGQGNNCGLWKLLHIMTVGFSEQRGGLELESAVRTFTPSEAAGVVREYIALFFGCEVCRNNFISKYDDCYSFRRCDRMPEETTIESVQDEDWREFPLWLWEFHAHVSIRIVQVKAKRDSDIDGKPKNDDEVLGIWPTMEECLMCYKEDGSWNMNEVYHFLEKTYWHASADFEIDRALKQYEYSTRASGKSSFRSYAGLGLILLALYAMKRRRVLLSGFYKKFDANPFGASVATGKKA